MNIYVPPVVYGFEESSDSVRPVPTAVLFAAAVFKTLRPDAEVRHWSSHASFTKEDISLCLGDSSDRSNGRYCGSPASGLTPAHSVFWEVWQEVGTALIENLRSSGLIPLYIPTNLLSSRVRSYVIERLEASIALHSREGIEGIAEEGDLIRSIQNIWLVELFPICTQALLDDGVNQVKEYLWRAIQTQSSIIQRCALGKRDRELPEAEYASIRMELEEAVKIRLDEVEVQGHLLVVETEVPEHLLRAASTLRDPDHDMLIYSLDGAWFVRPTRQRRAALPESWHGLAGEELSKASGVADALACSGDGEVVGAKSKAGAIELANCALGFVSA